MSLDDKPSGELPDWDPSREVDPGKIQAEYIEFMKEVMAEHKAEKAKRAKAEQDARGDLLRVEGGCPGVDDEAALPQPGRVIGFPKAPTFDELKERFKKAWEATKEIAPDAHYAVQCEIFRVLAYSLERSQRDAFMAGPPGDYGHFA